MTMENVQDMYPLSPAQEGILFHSLRETETGVYINQYCSELTGPFNPDYFEKAWQTALENYPILRSAFLWDGLDEPLQIVRRDLILPWESRDWSGNSADRQAQLLEELLAQDRIRGFELDRAPLMRCTIIKLGEDRHRFLWTSHHLLLDGWSSHALLNTIFADYMKLQSDQTLQPHKLRPYRDYIQWLQERDPAEAEQYWRKTLGDFGEATCIGSLFPISQESGYSQMERLLSTSETAALQDAARKYRVTQNTLVLGAWALTLARYADSTDVVFGATVSGRPADIQGVDEMIGMFINTLPVRVRWIEEENCGDWLKRIQQAQTDARQYEYTSLAQIPSWSALPAGQALFDNIVVFENYPLDDSSTNESSLTISDVQYREQSNYPLALLIVPGNELQIIAVHDRGVIDRKAMQMLLDNFTTALESIASNPEMMPLDLPVITREEQEVLLVNSRGPVSKTGNDNLIHHFFEKQAQQNPSATAVQYGSETLSYATLNRKANLLANQLHASGIEPGERIGVLLPRCAELPVALLGILKAGGAYVPLDAEYPHERINYILKDSGIRHLVCKGSETAGPEHFQGTIIDISQLRAEAESSRMPDAVVAAENLAYLIYTSGSTGDPKGVMVSHANVVHSTVSRFEYYSSQPQRFLLLSSFAFDSSVAGLFWTLSQGGTLIIPEESGHRDPEYLAQQIADRQISHILCIPSLYQHLLEHFGEKLTSLQCVIVAGEACPSDLIARHKALLPQCGLFNEYGPTEATVWCSVFDCLEPFTCKSVPIGRPIANTSLYVLNKRGQPVPHGIPGELFIGGAGITHGYLGKTELSEEKFVNKTLPGKSERLFRTGDRVRYLPDGNLEFLGRADFQLKIRGYRIEPGEIEALLREHPAVQEAVVIAVPSGGLPVDTETLAAHLLHLSTGEVDKLLQEFEGKPASPEGQTTRLHHGGKVQVSMQIDDDFINPPRRSQREWLINQVLAEFVADLKHLHTIAGDFVAGRSSKLDGYDISETDLDEQMIMEDWQTPVMRAMAGQVCDPQGDILEIGFGRGISAGIIQELGVKSHTIIESNTHSIERFFKPWQAKLAERDIRIIHGRWQDVLSGLSTYDGVFFHAFPLTEQEFIETVVNSITFAEHFFPVAVQLLKTGGAFTYLTTEVDSLSRRHQRALFNHFSSISMRVLQVEVPSDTGDTWWAKSMVIVKAVK